MRAWTGRIRLSGGRKKGPEVTARIVVNGDAVVVEVQGHNDALGRPRWEPSSPRQLDLTDLCRLLVEAAGKPAEPA